MKRVRLTQIDGKLPNLALMKLAHWHKINGDEVHFSRSPYRGIFEPEYDLVYGSAIFDFSSSRVSRLMSEFPGAIVGGTWNQGNPITVEAFLGIGENEEYDYSIYPSFTGSLGFTARGCRLNCGFCVVPAKEGKPRSVNTVANIWRGDPLPRHLHLLDNDFFGQPRDQWEARISEIREGNFRVCFNQGINIRMIDDVSAAAIASVAYYDDGFSVRRLYTAWDNIGHEARFFRGIETLQRHGVPPHHVMAYMLIGFDPRETWERVMYRLDKMSALGIRPYPMVFGDRHRRLAMGDYDGRVKDKTLGEFQRWVIRKAYTFVRFEDYDANAKGRPNKAQVDMFSSGGENTDD